MLLIVITACQNNEGPNQNRTHLLHDYSPLDEEGHVQAVVEMPAGTLQKWEVEKETGELEWEIKDGQRRVVDYLSYPGNYGMIPQTYLPSDKGGDGDPLDVLILGEATKRGEILPCEIIGVLKLLDRGEIDDRAAAGSLHSGNDRLTGKEIGLEVDRLAPVIELFVHVERRVPLVVGSVVNEDRDRPVRLCSFGNSLSQERNVGDVALQIERPVAGFLCHSIRKSACVGSLHKGHLGPLSQKALGQVGTDAGAATGDEYGCAFEVGKTRVSHGNRLRFCVGFALVPCGPWVCVCKGI